MISRCSVAEAVERFRSPDALEELSVAHGCAGLVVDGDRWPGDPIPDVPCVLIATSEGPGWAGFDVATSDPAAVVAGVEANPLASVALVQLLRRELADADDGLWAESVTYGMLQGGPEFARWGAEHPPSPPSDDHRPAVRVDRDGDRAEVVLDRPEVHNALSARMRDDLVAALTAVAADDTVTAVVLRGEGPTFSSGGDLREFGTFPDPVTAHAVRSTRLPARAVAAVRDRLEVRVHGTCRGAGVELAAFAHRVVAAPDTTFALPEVSMGLIPGSGGTWSVPTRVGRQRAAWLGLSGSSLDAATALDWGLVDEIAQ